jgi:tetratricopeptide (TPR) repeat protein
MSSATAEEGQPSGEAPDVSDAPMEVALEDMPEVSLEIFNVVKSSHAQHGLRHGDYVRYRQYCSRRLHRMRKAAGFLHGGTKGRYVKKVLEPHMIKDGRHLMLPLYAAERAWSYAMALKRENTAQEPRPRFHLLHRLKKAAKWSAALSALCATRGDKRTALEAEAYCGFMHGNMHLEREQWALALKHLRRTRTICTELCRVSMADQVHLYKQITEEVEPSIRFCVYNLRELGEEEADGAGEMEGDGEGMQGLLDGEAGSDILRSKLEAVLQESQRRQAQVGATHVPPRALHTLLPAAHEHPRPSAWPCTAAFAVELLVPCPARRPARRLARDPPPPPPVPARPQSLNEIDVLGERIMIKSDKVRIAILSSQQKILEIQNASKDAEGLIERYDELFVCFNDALDGVRADLRQAAKEQSARSGVAEASLQKLQASITWQKLDHTVARTMLLVEQFKRSMAGFASSTSFPGASGGGSGKKATPEDIVRLYDSAISSLQEMSQLDGYREDTTLMEQNSARQAAAKACRCFYLAESYGGASRFVEAQALYSRAADLMAQAATDLEEASFSSESAELASLANLEMLIDGARARAHAEAFVNGLDTDGADGAIEQMAIRQGGGAKATARADAPLIESVDVFERPKPENLVSFPPEFVTVACKPLLFDIARNQIAPPDLSVRLKANRGGGWGLRSMASGLFGGR